MFRVGVKVFHGSGNKDFPTKVIQYRGSVHIVPDWSVNHDSGDEDDGEHKIVQAIANGTMYNGSFILKG